jgi:hypothetical protein
VAKPVRLTLFVDNDQLKRAFDESANKVDRFGRDIEQHSSKVGTAAVAMGAFVAGAALSIVDKLGEVAVAAVKFLPALGEEFDNVADRIRVSVGDNPLLNGEVYATFQQLLPQVASPLEDVGEVVAVLAQRLGITGQAAVDVGGQILDLTRMTGGDLAANTQAIVQAFDLWGVATEDMPGLLDFLFRASQESGASIADLTTQLDGNSLSLKTLGFDLKDVITAAGGLDRAGISIAEIDQGLKRLIRNNPGKDLAAVFEDYVQGIEDGSITVEQVLTDLGARGGNAFFQLAQSGKLNFADLRTSIDGGTDSIRNAAQATEDWPEKWEQAQNRIKLALEPIAGTVFTEIGKILDIIFPTDDNGAPTGEVNIAGAWAYIATKWEESWPAIEAALASLWGKFTAWWNQDSTQQSIRDAGSALGNALWDGLTTAFTSQFENTGDDGVWGWIKRGLGFDGGLFKDAPIGLPSGADAGGSMPGNAMGGVVKAGMPSIVGEHKREMFVPKVDGKILPPHKMGAYMGGGDTFNIVAPSPLVAANEMVRVRRKQAYLAGVA